MKRKNLKKLALVVTAAVVADFMPAVAGGAETVLAADGTPGVTTFADKTDLMTVFDLDGQDDTVGRIVFGKNESGEVQEWYIAGTNTTVSGDNVVLFASSPLVAGSSSGGPVFESDYRNNKEYDPAWGCNYNGGSVTEVYPNHYGASQLRADLLAMQEDENYFSGAEQELMNVSTIATPDYKYDGLYYLNDKLYALDGVYTSPTIYAGIYSNGENNIPISQQYWGDYRIWLRTPYYQGVQGVIGRDRALVADSMNYNPGYVQVDGVPSDYRGNSIQPAFNLDLSSVLFASSVPVSTSSIVSGNLEKDSAMTLRMDGSEIPVGNVFYDSSAGTIGVNTDPQAAGSVQLVIQGNTDGTDWYYSKQVSGVSFLTAEDIRNQLALSSAPLLPDCKIWLETTLEDGLTYAVQAAAGTIHTVDAVDITGIDLPAGGDAFDMEAQCSTQGFASALPVTYHTSDGSAVTENSANWNTEYTASVTLSETLIENTAYVFADSIEATVDGNPATVTRNDDGSITISVSFATSKQKIESVTAPSGPADNRFSDYYTAETILSDGTNKELGSQAQIILEGNTEPVNMPVNWTIEGTYDAAAGAQNTFRWTVPVSAYEDYDVNGNELSGTIEIWNKEASSDEKGENPDPGNEGASGNEGGSGNEGASGNEGGSGDEGMSGNETGTQLSGQSQNSAPQTGDSSFSAFWFELLLLSFGCLTGITAYTKKQNRK